MRGSMVALVLVAAILPPARAQVASDALRAALPSLCTTALGGLAQRCATLAPGGDAAFAAAARGQRLEELPGHARVGDLHGDDARPPAPSGGTGWDLWATALGGALDRREGRIEAGFDASREGLLAGAGWRPAAAWTVDAGWLWSRESLDYRGSEGRLASRLDGPLLLVAWAPNAAWRAEVQAERVHGRLESTRAIAYGLPGGLRFASEARARPTTSRQTLGAALRRSDAFGAWSLDAGLAIDESSTRVGAFTESGGDGWAIAVPARERRSRRTSADAVLSKAVSRPSGVWVPSLRVTAIRENADPRRTLGIRLADDPTRQLVRFSTEEPDRQWVDAALGLAWLRPGGTTWFIEVRGRGGHAFLDERAAAVGWRIER